MVKKFQISQIVHNKNFKHGALYTIFSFANSGISFILLLVLARYLTPSDYGSLNLFTTFVTLINILITLCTVSYVSVSFFQKSREELNQIILISFITTSGMLLFLSLILLIIPNIVQKCIGVSINYLWIGLLICYFQVFNSLNLDIWRLEENPIKYGFYSISFAICNFILTLLFIVVLHKGWVGRVYAWISLGIIYFIISIIFLIKRKYLIFSQPSVQLFKETFLYALPLIPHTASFWIRQGLDRYIINYYYDQTDVGYFSFALNLATIITIVGSAFNSTNSVFVFKKLAKGYNSAKQTLSNQIKLMTIIFIAVSIFVGIFAFVLIHFCIPTYNISVRYIIPLCLNGFFQCIYLLWVNYLFFYKKTKLLMYITFSCALLQAWLSLWLTQYSVLFTAWISAGTNALIMILVIISVKSTVKKMFNNYATI